MSTSAIVRKRFAGIVAREVSLGVAKGTSFKKYLESTLELRVGEFAVGVPDPYPFERVFGFIGGPVVFFVDGNVRLGRRCSECRDEVTEQVTTEDENHNPKNDCDRRVDHDERDERRKQCNEENGNRHR